MDESIEVACSQRQRPDGCPAVALPDECMGEPLRFGPVRTTPTSSDEVPRAAGCIVLGRAWAGVKVAMVQRRLGTTHELDRYGSDTMRAVEAFQGRRDLRVTGKVNRADVEGARVRQALLHRPLHRSANRDGTGRFEEADRRHDLVGSNSSSDVPTSGVARARSATTARDWPFRRCTRAVE